MVFTNLHSFLSQEVWVSAVVEIVEASLRDDRLEVREKSAKILSGLLHCEFIRGDRKRKLIVSCRATFQVVVGRHSSEVVFELLAQPSRVRITVMYS